MSKKPGDIMAASSMTPKRPEGDSAAIAAVECVSESEDTEIGLSSNAAVVDGTPASAKPSISTSFYETQYMVRLRRRRIKLRYMLRKQRAQQKNSDYQSTTYQSPASEHSTPFSAQQQEVRYKIVVSCGEPHPDVELGLDNTSAFSVNRSSRSMSRFLYCKAEDGSIDLNLYTWMLVLATAPGVSTLLAMVCLFVTLIFPLVISSMGNAVIYELTTPACVSHDDCGAKFGLSYVCVPTMGYLTQATLSPGRCRPCDFVSLWADEHHFTDFLNTVHSTREDPHSLVNITCPYCEPGRTWLDSSVTHCEKHSTEVACKFLLEVQEHLWHFPLFLIFVCLAVWSMTAIDEVNDACKCYRILRYRLHSMPNGCQKEVLLLIGRLALFRRASITTCLAHSGWALLVTGGFEASDILLDLLGLSFLTTIDDILPSLLLRPQSREYVLAGIRKMKAHDTRGIAEWFVIRAFVVCIAATTTFLIAHPLYVAQMRYQKPESDINCSLVVSANSYLVFCPVTYLSFTAIYYVAEWHLNTGSRLKKTASACVTALLYLLTSYTALTVSNGLFM